MSDKKVKFLGITIYKRKTKGNKTTTRFLGLPIWKKVSKKGSKKYYFLGMKVYKKNLDILHSRQAPSKDIFNLNCNELNIAIKLEGGLGDFIIASNFLYLLKNKIGNNKVRIDVFAFNKQKLLETIFNKNNFINNLYSKEDIGLADTRYDLLLLILRKPVILHAKKNKIYEYSPQLFDLVQKYEAQNVKERRLFLKRPYCDCQNISLSLIFEKKRYQETDIDDILKMNEHFEYPLFIKEDELVYLSQLNIQSQQYISIHRGVDQRSDKNSVKQWPIKYYNILIAKIKQQYPDLKIVQLGISEDRCPAFENIDVNLVGKTNLEQIKVLLKNSLLHIDGEGGMVHLRHALNGGKSIVLFGSTSLEFYGYPENINLKGDGCSHWCEWITENWQAKCARGYDRPPCMYSLIPEKVFEAFKKFMEEQ